MKILPVGSKLFHAGGRTDGETWRSYSSQFWETAWKTDLWAGNYAPVPLCPLRNLHWLHHDRNQPATIRS